jgi:hypothetical protein
LADITPHDFDLIAKMAEIGGLRIDIHADDLFAALRQERNEPSPDEPSATGDKGRHGCPSRMVFMNNAEDQTRLGSNWPRSFCAVFPGERLSGVTWAGGVLVSSFISLSSSLLVRCLYRPGEFLG